MKSSRKTADEQYTLVMECRRSGLTDQQWCLQQGINPSTFYTWVKRLRKKACYDIPNSNCKAVMRPAIQEVVKVDIIPDTEPDPQTTPTTPTTLPFLADPASSASAPIEVRIQSSVISITNDVDPRLLTQILRYLGGSVC